MLPCSWRRLAALGALGRGILGSLGRAGSSSGSTASPAGMRRRWGGDAMPRSVRSPTAKRAPHSPVHVAPRLPMSPYLVAPPGHGGDDIAPSRIPLDVGGHVVLRDIHDRTVRSVNEGQGAVHTGEQTAWWAFCRSRVCARPRLQGEGTGQTREPGVP